MTLIESTAHAAKVAGKNFIPYIIVCVLLAVGIIAYDTDGFTKPPSWFSAFHNWSVDPVVPAVDVPTDYHETTKGQPQ